MPRAAYTVTYVESSGKAHTVQVKEGWSLMEGAVRALIPGIDADCGGACSCATCQVYVDAEWEAKLPPRSEMEDSMLDFAPERQANSRLSCQLKMTAELDGIVVYVPDMQR
jgi:2Fe-2S ferredoxin